MSYAQDVKELRAAFNTMKQAFVAVPPHPSNVPPEAQGAPPQGMPPEAQGMPPQGMPPEAQGMPPQGMPPEAQGAPPQGGDPAQQQTPVPGMPPELMEFLDQVVGKIEQVGQQSSQNIQAVKEENAQIKQQLATVMADFDKERAVRQERQNVIKQMGM